MKSCQGRPEGIKRFTRGSRFWDLEKSQYAWNARSDHYADSTTDPDRPVSLRTEPETASALDRRIATAGMIRDEKHEHKVNTNGRKLTRTSLPVGKSGSQVAAADRPLLNARPDSLFDPNSHPCLQLLVPHIPPHIHVLPQCLYSAVVVLRVLHLR